ncbi:hypothetical protein [Alcanivorax sp.]|uniref:hypothetical protein n=1 Tax=Alcanivorax sp. TaxID=1872427 RepID=UPI0025900826|nr:hypothetical protein [Alcanivorax sp.]
MTDVEEVRALNKERQKWQDAALSGRLPERLPRTIDAGTLKSWFKDHEGRKWDVITLLEGGREDNTGPHYGGKYVAMSMVGCLGDDFNGVLPPTVLDIVNIHGVDWFVLTDSTETWVEAEFNARPLPVSADQAELEKRSRWDYKAHMLQVKEHVALLQQKAAGTLAQCGRGGKAARHL